MEFVHTTIHSLSAALHIAAGALKNITPAGVTALLTAITMTASSAFASHGKNGDTTTTHYGLWVATALTTTLVLAGSILFFCRRTSHPAHQPLLSNNTGASSSSSAASSSYASRCSVTPSLITPRDSSRDRISQALISFRKLASGDFVAAFSKGIFICNRDLSRFEKIQCPRPFQHDQNMFHVIGNEVYIIDSYITSHKTQAFHLTRYNTVTKELTEERDIPFEALGMVTTPEANLGKTITCYERTEDGSNMIGTPHGVTSIVNGETTRIYSDPSGENNSPVLSIKKYNNNIIVGLANGNILMFDENSNNIVRLIADPLMYGIQGDAVTSLQIVGDQLLASYITTLCSQGKILIWDLKANQIQPPVLLAPTNSKPPVVISNGLVVLSTGAGTIQIWNPSTRRLMKEFDLLGTINMNPSRKTSELNDIRRASVECSGDRIIVRARTGLYELPLPSAE